MTKKLFIFLVLVIIIPAWNIVFSQTGNKQSRIGSTEKSLMLNNEQLEQCRKYLGIKKEHVENDKSGTNNQLSNNNGYDDVELHSAINPLDTSNIVVSWMSLQQNPTGTSDALIFYVYYTKDFGQTWHVGSLDFSPTYPIIAGGGDPVFAFDNTGKCYLTWLYLSMNLSMNIKFEMYYAWSADGGATWTREPGGNDIVSSGNIFVDSQGNITGMSGHVPDKEWLTVDPNTNDLYLSMTDMTNLVNNTGIWGVRKKSASGITFTSTTIVPSSTQYFAVQGALASDKNGILHVVYPCLLDTATSKISLFHSQSTDGAVTFSTPVEIATFDGSNFASFNQTNNTGSNIYERMYPACYIATDCSNGPYSGNIYVVWNGNDTISGNGLDCYISRSTDGGNTWSSPLRINDDPQGLLRHQHRPTIYVNTEGLVIVGWYDTRNDSLNNLNEYYMAYSVDGGQSFCQNINVTHNPFDISILNSSSVIGEYYQILATKGNAIPFWTNWDGSDLEVYCGIFPFNSSSGVHEMQPVTDKFNLLPVVPNPANDRINLSFFITQPADVSIKIVSETGSLIQNVTHERFESGKHDLTIDTGRLGQAIYFAVVSSHFGMAVRKFVISK